MRCAILVAGLQCAAMAKRLLAGGIALLALLACAGPASAGTYDVVSCGAPGANGVNQAWQVYPGFDDNYWDIAPSCPELGVWSERRANAFAPFFNGAGYHIKAPAGATLDKIAIWRKGYRFNNTGKTPQGPWAVGGYRGDGTVIGGPLLGETCNIQPGQIHCEMPYWGTRVDRDLETNEVLYSVSCFEEPNCPTARPEDGFPFAGLTISASIVTVRDEGRPAILARGPLTAPGWRTTDAPLHLGASDPVGVRRVRVLVDGAPVRTISPGCDYTRVAPCGQVPERAMRLGASVPDGSHVVGVEATDTAGNVARVDRRVTVDRNPPPLEFLPATGRKRIAVAARDAGSGTTAGTIEVRRRGTFRVLPTRLRGTRLVARLGRGSRRGRTFRASAVDAVGHRAVAVGAPVRFRAGFGPRMRRSVRTGLNARKLVRGRLRAFGGRPLAGRQIAVESRLRREGAVPVLAVQAVTDARGRFRVRMPPGASRVVTVRSPGTGGLQGARRRLNLRVPWSSTLRIRPRTVVPGGRMRLSGRLRLRGFELPRSGKRVELQAFDGGRWRVFATTRAFGPRARWRASYQFGTTPGQLPHPRADPVRGHAPVRPRLLPPGHRPGGLTATIVVSCSLWQHEATLVPSPHASGAPHDALDDRGELARRAGRVERGGSFAGGGRGGRVRQDRLDRRRGGGRVARFVEPPAGGRDDLERARRGRGDDRAARGERLDEREPERLALAAVQQAVGFGERRARIVDRAEEPHAAGEVGPRRPFAAAPRRSRGGSPGSGAPARSSRSSGTRAATSSARSGRLPGTSAPRKSARGGGPGGAGRDQAARSTPGWITCARPVTSAALEVAIAAAQRRVAARSA